MKSSDQINKKNIIELPRKKNTLDLLDFFKNLIKTGISAIESFSKYIEELGNKIRDPMELEELADTFSKPTEEIKLSLTKDGLKFIGGKLSIGPHDISKKSVMIHLEMYSQDSAGKWRKSETSKPIPGSTLTKNALRQIQEKAIAFEII